ncbi:MAG TPA: hypothetical protein VFH88_10840 [Candidatus Krumholzibacteria bacterium]|nr:hypothetical protein [Candidatus Krumholzibacteria bacterium]
MMKRTLAILAVCMVPLALSGCYEDKVLDIVITGETSAEFSQNETSEQWTNPVIINIAQEIRDILSRNGYDEGDLTGAHVTSASYGVTSFSQAHDWEISGAITVTYNGNTQAILNYTSQSVSAALGKKTSASLESGGVDLINAALQDFLDGSDPVLTLTINNGSTTPAPSVGDPMIFDWRAWLAIQVIVSTTASVIDPF